MKKLILAMAVLMSSAAFAEGFVCENFENALRVKVFNHVTPSEGTRSVAVMVLSDTSIEQGRKTIATISADDFLVTNESAVYSALVDLRYSESSRKGENIAGTKLGQLKYVILDIGFTYARPVPAGTRLEGELILKKRSGEDIRLDVSCWRYLKN
jgi:hypothetical protein